MDNVLPTGGHLSPGWTQILIVIGAIAAMTALIFFWVVIFHKRGLKQRRRRRNHRGRTSHNPTLAETGGLPPVRPKDQPPKF
jgi:hypothetical protein